MRKEDPLSGELQELESALARSMKPLATTIDPLAAAFAAGSRSRRTEIRAWQSAVAALLIVAVGIWPTPTRPVVTRAPMTVVAIHEDPMPPASPASLIMLQRAVSEHGMDGLPQSNVPASGAMSARDAL